MILGVALAILAIRIISVICTSVPLACALRDNLMQIHSRYTKFLRFDMSTTHTFQSFLLLRAPQ